MLNEPLQRRTGVVITKLTMLYIRLANGKRNGHSCEALDSRLQQNVIV